MNLNDILGQEFIKKHVVETVRKGRIPHAQLFVGPEGSGVLPMAIAYARHILEQTTDPNKQDPKQIKLQMDQLVHPDVHFIYPKATNAQVKKDPKSIDFITEWRSFVLENPYANVFEWYQKIDIGNKQGIINVLDAQDIMKSLSFKSFTGGYKIVIIWHAEKMNVETANKLLKLIEEPEDKTLLLLLTDALEDILETIKSRCQIITFPKLPEQIIIDELMKRNITDSETAYKIAVQAQGNFNAALRIANEEVDTRFDEWFVSLVRVAFKAKGNPASVLDLLTWGDVLSKEGRETQKQFLNYCIEVFRQALLFNYNAKELVFVTPKVNNFKFDKFSEFVHNNNILEIFEQLQNAVYHIERNANSKILFTDLSINLIRLIHKK